MYKNDVGRAEAELQRFVEQIQYQSHPTSKDFKEIADSVKKLKNPIRQALFRAASAYKKSRENAKDKDVAFAVSGQIYKTYKLVQQLSGDEKASDTVLNKKLLDRGAHAIDIAKFMLLLMIHMYKWGSTGTSKPGSSKAYALRWIIISYYKTKQYDRAIKLAEDKETDYRGLCDENVVSIYRNVGLCYEELKEFKKALDNLTKSRSMRNTVLRKLKKKNVKKSSQNYEGNIEDSIKRLETNIPFMRKDISRVTKSLRLQNKP